MDDITYKQVHEEINQYLDFQALEGHTITAGKIDNEFNYASRKAKRYRWQVLNEYVKEEKLQRLTVDKYKLVNGGSTTTVPNQEAAAEALAVLGLSTMDVLECAKISIADLSDKVRGMQDATKDEAKATVAAVLGELLISKDKDQSLKGA